MKKYCEEVNFGMSKTSYRKTKKTEARSNSYIILDEKKMALSHLEKAVEKMKEARREIRKVARFTMELKENGDEIADKVISAVAETFGSYDGFWVL
jgi:flagellar biosynthesis component FlhA